jgi:hypothetical protein
LLRLHLLCRFMLPHLGAAWQTHDARQHAGNASFGMQTETTGI